MNSVINVIIRVLEAFFWMLIMFAFGGFFTAFLSVCCAIIHELGHLIVIRFVTKRKISFPRVVLSGFRIKSTHPISFKQEIYVCAAGPFSNLLFFVVFMPIHKEFAMINLATAIANLFVFDGSDGYKILYCLLSLLSTSEKAYKITSLISLLFSFLALFASLYMILKLNSGYWIFIVFFTICLRKTAFLQKLTKNE